MSQIEIDKGLAGYLEKDVTVVEESRRAWEPEFNALCHLTDIFCRLRSLVVVAEARLDVPTQLFLVTLNQLYGVSSELLRRRTNDAQILSRRAIEAAGIAHRLWEDQALIKVFNEAYPYINDSESDKQFKPSKEYREEFKPDRLFSGESSAWRTLRSLYEVFSAGATHAGIGALRGLSWEKGVLTLPVRETDPVEIGRSWHSVMRTFWEVLKVFLAILRTEIPGGMVATLEADMKQWLEEYKRIAMERTPWIPKLSEPVL